MDVWTRHQTPARRPKLTRDDIAAAAIGIGDREGLAEISMRRLAAELEIATMSLYHYVKTKDELMSLVLDAFMGEVLIPDDVRWPSRWRDAIALVASASRVALERHPWVLDIADDPPIGPNAIKHYDQCLRALRGLDVALTFKLDLAIAVDEYVFGHCLHARNNLDQDLADDEELMRYVGALVTEGNDYLALRELVEEHGLEETWSLIHTNLADRSRFERNLGRLLDGFELAATATSRPRRGRQ